MASQIWPVNFTGHICVFIDSRKHFIISPSVQEAANDFRAGRKQGYTLFVQKLFSGN